MKTAVVILLSAACTVLASETRTFDRTLPVTGVVDLDVTSGPGGVRITVGPGLAVQVHAVIRPLYGAFDLGLAEANIRALEQNPPVEQLGNRVRIGHADPPVLRGVSVTYEIQTPRETRIRVLSSAGGIYIDGIAGPAIANSSSGRIEIGNVAKEVVAKSSSGAIAVHDAGGRVTAENTSGGIQVLRSVGPAELKTTSGRTEVDDVRGDLRSTTYSGNIRIYNAFGPVQAETKSGAIRISQNSPAPVTAQSGSGSIAVTLADGHGYNIDARSGSGRVEGPSTAGSGRIAEDHRLKGQIRGGGPLVGLNSRSSKITIN